jgi:hypothetical protein
MSLKFFVKGNADVVDAALSKADGGAKLDRGIRELVASEFPHVEVETANESSMGFAALRAELESGDSRLIEDQPQIVLLSIARDIRELGYDGATIDEAVSVVAANLVAAIGLIKEKVGAHVLIANASTLDPDHEVFDYHNLSDEPMSLRAHRLDLMLIGVSHSEGISVIDVDRIIAEVGGAKGVTAVLDYSVLGCQAIAAEIVRVIADYGFFDDRPLLAQAGAGAGGK